MSPEANNGSAPLVTFEELSRLREIEHLAWHMMDDSEENGGTGQVTITPMREDYEKLAALLPEDHPPEWLPAPLSSTVPKERWPTLEQAERDLDFAQLYRLASKTIDGCLTDIEQLSARGEKTE